jgi:VWFA-related protein
MQRIPQLGWLILIIALVFAGNSLGQSQRSPSSVAACDRNSASVFVDTAVWGLDSKTYIKELTFDKFRLTSEKETHEIQCFSKADEPFTVGFVVDFSSSIKGNDLARFFDGIRIYIDSSNVQNTYFAVGFNDEPFGMLERTSDRMKIETFLTDAVTRKPKGKSSLRDAIEMAVNKMLADDANRKVLIIFSDGEENNSRSGDVSPVIKKLRLARIRSFVTNLIDPKDSYSYERITNESTLGRIAAETGGGVAFGTKETGLAKYFEALAKMMRNEYRLGFNPAKAQNKWNPITYAVKVPKDFERITTTGIQRSFY